ncbi:LacI family DNA-binding transcriptional regulator [Pseudorhodoferax sp. Leaf274]|uniref:LacI family DNA-binding transcriptional regulator n=1 Tax=Pseudorhodoferax sp. Leaf274 TaxID=1736318 RepID=UPI0007039164|nr:LacI family DNA-binding transcriptional regulator [Pseudorhodoferax sp. Leaf274]KQP47659.1 GntR family transcriptional regulator [Pseudorhodoferax sp. Leaf274]
MTRLLPPPDRQRATTVLDVARLAGVSAMTVSRTLNQPQRVPPATRQRVQAAVQATQYVPNLLACGLRSRRSRLVAAIVPALGSPVFSDTVQALTATLAEAGYHLMLGQSGYGPAGEDALLQAVIRRRPDGIVLVGVDHSRQARDTLAGCGVPVVETWDLTPAPIDMLVGFSHADVGAAVCRFLAGQGRRRLAVVSGADARAARRTQAFQATAHALGLPTPAVVEAEAPTTLGHGRQALRALLALPAGVDGIFCSSDMLALGVLTEAAHQGIAVPGRIGVVGFGDQPFAADAEPALTTVRVDGARIGHEAALRVIGRIAGAPAAELPALDVGFSIFTRRSA